MLASGLAGLSGADAAEPKQKQKAKAWKKGTTKIRLGKGRTGCVKLPPS